MNTANKANSLARYEIAYRDVKYPRLEFKTGKLIVIAPKRGKNIEGIVQKHANWAAKKNATIQAAIRASKNKKLYTERGEQEFKELARKSTHRISKELGLRINNLCFRKMNSKWGSCSSKKNLTLNTQLRYLPKSLIDYVVYHETLHLLEKKHNKRFWTMIAQKFPNYERKEKDLLIYWFLIQQKLAAYQNEVRYTKAGKEE